MNSNVLMAFTIGIASGTIITMALDRQLPVRPEPRPTVAQEVHRDVMRSCMTALAQLSLSQRIEYNGPIAEKTCLDELSGRVSRR